ncbi:hypothetical protein JTE90_012872 [Oedothorax gibbosus]|uniref:Transposase n=1 Tax=Oedothorax gibbosus TaxID=931172 RepID=A0AAV6UQI8_9ARAC|nr:hypothetical protein JTE90_012872 [Oedothorax gibbosus]
MVKRIEKEWHAKKHAWNEMLFVLLGVAPLSNRRNNYPKKRSVVSKDFLSNSFHLLFEAEMFANSTSPFLSREQIATEYLPRANDKTREVYPRTGK